MKASIVKIGNSRGIRIPKPVFEQCGFKEEVELEIQDDKLIIYQSSKVRENWEESFKSMADRGDDMIDNDYLEVSTEWEKNGWEWK